MAITPPLQPTLWRTCRVLANRSRLEIFALLVQQSVQTVSIVAGRLKLPLPVASQYLRALEARGLLISRRVGRRVNYSLSVATGDPVHGLVEALRRAFQRDSHPVESLFKTATAFTHPRRVEIFRSLHRKPQTLEQLQAASGISLRALARHLGKLEARGFVVCRLEDYAVMDRPDAFGRELARAAVGS